MPTDGDTSLTVWLVNQGVAVGVAAFVLIRVESRLREVHQAIDDLTLALLRTGGINGAARKATNTAESPAERPVQG